MKIDAKNHFYIYRSFCTCQTKNDFIMLATLTLTSVGYSFSFFKLKTKKGNSKGNAMRFTRYKIRFASINPSRLIRNILRYTRAVLPRLWAGYNTVLGFKSGIGKCGYVRSVEFIQIP